MPGQIQDKQRKKHKHETTGSFSFAEVGIAEELAPNIKDTLAMLDKNIKLANKLERKLVNENCFC